MRYPDTAGEDAMQTPASAAVVKARDSSTKEKTMTKPMRRDGEPYPTPTPTPSPTPPKPKLPNS